MKIIPPISVEEYIDLIHKPSIRDEENKGHYRSLLQFYKNMNKNDFYQIYLKALERKRIYEDK